MYISKIEKDNKKRYRIYGEESFLFTLYAGELKRYNISEGMNIDNNIIDYIFTDVIHKRAKSRALFLLDRKPYSENMMRRKLLSNGYPDSIVDDVVSFLVRYNYLNDYEYTLMYIRSCSGKKSKKQIIYNLMNKGIDKEIIINAMDDENLAFSENNCLEKQFRKYVLDKDISDPKVKQKVFRHFYGKGFSIDSINRLLSGDIAY